MEQSNRNPISPLEIINLWPGHNLTIELIPEDGVTVIRHHNRDSDALLIIYQEFISNSNDFYAIDVGINENRNLPNSQNIRTSLKDLFSRNHQGVPKYLIANLINKWVELITEDNDLNSDEDIDIGFNPGSDLPPEESDSEDNHLDARRELDFSNFSYKMVRDGDGVFGAVRPPPIPPPPPPRLRRQNAQVDLPLPQPPLRRHQAVVLDFPQPDQDPNAGVAVNLRAPGVIPDDQDQEQEIEMYRSIKCAIVQQFRDQWNNQLHLLFHTSEEANIRFEMIVLENVEDKQNLNEMDRKVRQRLQTFVDYEKIYFINVLENRENAVEIFNNLYGVEQNNCIGGDNGILLYEGNPGFVERDEENVMGFNFDSPTLVINGNTYREGFVYDKDNIEMRGLDNETLKNIAPGWKWVSKPGAESLNLMELTYKFNYKMGDDNVTQVTTRLTNRDD